MGFARKVAIGGLVAVAGERGNKDKDINRDGRGYEVSCKFLPHSSNCLKPWRHLFMPSYLGSRGRRLGFVGEGAMQGLVATPTAVERDTETKGSRDGYSDV